LLFLIFMIFFQALNAQKSGIFFNHRCIKLLKFNRKFLYLHVNDFFFQYGDENVKISQKSAIFIIISYLSYHSKLMMSLNDNYQVSQRLSMHSISKMVDPIWLPGFSEGLFIFMNIL